MRNHVFLQLLGFSTGDNAVFRRQLNLRNWKMLIIRLSAPVKLSARFTNGVRCMKKLFAFGAMLTCSMFALPAVFAEETASKPCASVQDFTPIKQVCMYLDGFHTYRKEKDLKGEAQKQIRTAHYCKQVNPDLFQCLLYDGNGTNARVIGIEYVISDKLFRTLPASEQKYWHAHDSEVDENLLVLPGLKAEEEKNILSTLRTTHGKTWQVWPNLSDAVPVGEPVLMWNVEPNKISTKTKQSVAARKLDPMF